MVATNDIDVASALAKYVFTKEQYSKKRGFSTKIGLLVLAFIVVVLCMVTAQFIKDPDSTVSNILANALIISILIGVICFVVSVSAYGKRELAYHNAAKNYCKVLAESQVNTVVYPSLTFTSSDALILEIRLCNLSIDFNCQTAEFSLGTLVSSTSLVEVLREGSLLVVEEARELVG